MMYVPKGFAHGFVTLLDSTETFYFASDFYSSELERGIRHDDPYFKIDWPIEVIESSEKDKNFPDFNLDWHGISSFSGLT